MPIIITEHIGRVCLSPMANTGVKEAIKYLGTKLRIKATRKVYGNHYDKRRSCVYIVLTIGKPNYSERKFVKLCEKSGEKFPVRKIQLKYFPWYKR